MADDAEAREKRESLRHGLDGVDTSGLSVSQLRKLHRIGPEYRALLADQMREERAAAREARGIDRGVVRRVRGVVRPSRRSKELLREMRRIEKLNRSAVAMVQDGKAETLLDAQSMMRADRRFVDRQAKLPEDLVCPCCHQPRPLSKQWVALTGRRSRRHSLEVKMLFFEWMKIEMFSVSAVCRVCWEGFKRTDAYKSLANLVE